MNVSLESRSESDTHALGVRLGGRLRPGDVVALRGELGAGKTRFVAGLAEGLGLDPRDVNSPTFVIVQDYGPAEDRPGPHLVHVDAYRIASDDDLLSIGWDELLTSGAVVAIEWSERVAASIPTPHVVVRIDHGAADDERILSISAPEAIADRLSRLDRAADRPCPSCGTMVSVDGASFPFCSARCRMADLGDWFAERRRIPSREPGEFED